MELPEFSNARQSLSVCAFNDKHFFLFGGKTQSNEFVSDVEVFDIDRNLWRTLNYISDKGKLRLVYPGCFQVTGKKIMVFGGCRQREDEEENVLEDNGQKVVLTNETLFLNVTNGELKRGPEL